MVFIQSPSKCEVKSAHSEILGLYLSRKIVRPIPRSNCPIGDD